MSTLIDAAKRAKHSLFVKAGPARRMLLRARESMWRRSITSPYRYLPEGHRTKYTDAGEWMPRSSTFPVDHLLHAVPLAAVRGDAAAAPRRVFVLWLGDAPMGPNRVSALESLRAADPGLEFVLVTDSDVDRWIKPDAPLPRAFWNLSAVHRSDVLRAYLAHHHGGAYVDLKTLTAPMSPLFDLVTASNIWIAGPFERDSKNVTPAFGDGPLGDEQRHRFHQIVSQACFVVRPDTALTSEWWAEVCRRLAYFEDLLAFHPATDAYGGNPGYPVPWHALLGAVFSPLVLKYSEHVSTVYEPRFVGGQSPADYR